MVPNLHSSFSLCSYSIHSLCANTALYGPVLIICTLWPESSLNLAVETMARVLVSITKTGDYQMEQIVFLFLSLSRSQVKVISLVWSRVFRHQRFHCKNVGWSGGCICLNRQKCTGPDF